MLTYNSYGNEYKIKLRLEQYRDGQLAICADYYDEDCKSFLPFSTMTINLNYEENDPAPEDCAYLDINKLHGIEDWVMENELGEPTGKRKQSGFCTYPLYKFDITKIKSIIAETEK